MMRRVWAAGLTALAVVGVFLVLATSQRRPVMQQAVPGGTPGGALVPVGSASAGTTHGTTSTSGVTTVTPSAGPVASAGIPVTRSS